MDNVIKTATDFLLMLFMLYLGYIVGQSNPVEQPTKQEVRCGNEYIPPCSEEITFNIDVPDKCWIEED